MKGDTKPHEVVEDLTKLVMVGLDIDTDHPESLPCINFGITTFDNISSASTTMFIIILG